MKDVVHRDLKPANILLSADMSVKLGDFGLAKVFDEAGAMMSTYLGTPYYMAPEILEGKKYDERADLWSVGVILFQMVCGKVPFPAKNPHELKEKVQRGEFKIPEDVYISPLCVDMICNLIILDP